jgi:sialic acid synthase SpsE
MAHAQRALGDGIKRCQPAEAVNVAASRRGLYAARALPAGTVLEASDVVALRPATELSASSLDVVLGTTLARDVAAGAAFAASDIRARTAA